jgi:hypothetical protein
MLEQLNQTLEEEKKTLLLQVNKLLEQVICTSCYLLCGDNYDDELLMNEE